jgi:hypothetical protein
MIFSGSKYERTLRNISKVHFHVKDGDTSVRLALEKSLPSWKREGDLILYQERIYVPRDKELKAPSIMILDYLGIRGKPARNWSNEIFGGLVWGTKSIFTRLSRQTSAFDRIDDHWNPTGFQWIPTRIKVDGFRWAPHSR